MKKFEWSVACAFFLAATAFVSAAPRQSSAGGTDTALNGTWKIDAGQTKFSPKPISFYISEGWYHCTSCNPAIDIKADGTDQPVQGHAYDTLSMKAVDDTTAQEIGKKDGKVMFEETYTVSKDGKVLTAKITSHPMDGSAPITTEGTAKRVGLAPMGVHAVSGKWQLQKFNQSANGLTFTYKVDGDELTMSDPTGESYTAKLDGTDAPVKGAYGYDTVSVKKLGPNTIEETDKLNGNVIDVSKITVHGSSMTIEETNQPTGRTSTYTAHKQG
jgi:hypothetical protein